MTEDIRLMAKLKRAFGFKKAIVSYLREQQMIDGELFCALCKEPLSKAKTSIDHITPLSKGGEERLENYQLVHIRCNHRKGSKTKITMIETAEQ